MAKVSIVLPVYNGEEFLAQSIESVINQTYKDWELIIVNDCSTDSSLEIAKKYAQKDRRITIINNETNKKIAESLNTGFRKAKGEYYTWTSDDNEYYPQAIEKMVDFLENNRAYGMVHAICKVVGSTWERYWGDIVTYPISLLDFPSVGACFLYRSKIAKLVGEYDSKRVFVEDHDYWLRFLLISPIASISDILYMYRRHSNSITVSTGDISAKIRVLLMLEYLPYYKEKFPQYKNDLNETYGLSECISNEDDEEYNKLKVNYKKGKLYSKLKQIYRLKHSKWQIQKIKQLGFIYYLKAIKLMINCKRGQHEIRY